MSKLLILKGLPGSGKTTWAKQYQKDHPNTKRVNRDELRAMLDDSVWSKENENFVVSMEEAIITHAIQCAYDIIVDDTNLSEKILHRWQRIADEHNEGVRILIDLTKDSNIQGVEVEIKEFNTPVEECIARDAKREGRARVGEAVIRRFYNDHYANKTKD